MLNRTECLATLVLAGMLCPAVRSHAERPSTLDPTVRISFDRSASAGTAEGRTVEPLEAQAVKFTDGLRSRALRAETGILLRYPRNLLPGKHGSVSMWVRLTTPLDEGGWRFFFSEGAAWASVGMPRLWLHNPGDLRFDMDGGRRYFIRPMRPWPVGTWRHFVMAWDADQGRSFLYGNGRLIGQWAPPDPWQTDPSDSFRIGSGLDLGKGNRPALADIDEVAIYDRVLAEKEVDRVYQSMELPVLEVRNPTPIVDAGAGQIRLELVNMGYGRAAGTAIWPCDGKKPARISFALDHHQVRTLDVSLVGRTAGFHAIPVTLKDMARVPDQVIEAGIFIRANQRGLPDRPMAWRLVERVDCAQQPPAGSVGQTPIVRSPLGAYREAGPQMDNRFVYAFKL